MFLNRTSRQKTTLATSLKPYFGGGTLLFYRQHKLGNNCHYRQQVSLNAEITLEANPDDLNTRYLKVKRTSVNRLSIENNLLIHTI